MLALLRIKTLKMKVNNDRFLTDHAIIGFPQDLLPLHMHVIHQHININYILAGSIKRKC